MGEQLVVTPAIVQNAARVQVAECRRQQRLAAVKQQLSIRAQAAVGHLANRCVEPGERSQQPIDVLIRSPVHDVEVLSRCWRPVEDRGSASDDDELHARFEQLGEQAVEVSDARMRHGPL